MSSGTRDELKMDEVRKSVAEHYGKVAERGSCCGGGTARGGCGGDYSAADLAAAPEGSNLGLGCGNPVDLASLREGETVVDLGSGAGFDCFIAAERVGPGGSVIGVDMTAAMLSKARENTRRAGYANVEFRLGEIEHLPVADASADVVISNCVINLSPDKGAVYREAFRVLRPGGRVAVSDIVRVGEFPAQMRANPEAWSACVTGAATPEEHAAWLAGAGFTDVSVERAGGEGPAVSARIRARRPA